MSNNVASFQSFDSDWQIAAHQAGLVRIVLEGPSDVDLFSRFWFCTMRESFEFIDASHLTTGAGCTAVRAAVTRSLDVDKVPAVGIVDRDSLFREARWDLLFSVNDAQFATDVQTPEVYVTSLWEVEAYMLEPNLLADWVFASHKKPPGSAVDCAAALGRALTECELLLDAASFFAAAHVAGVPCSNSHFRSESSAKVKEACENKIAALSAENQAVAMRVNELIAEVRKNQPTGDAERMIFFLRYIDTKRLLIRLFHALNLKDDTHWMLPTIQLAGNRRPAELERLLKTVIDRFAV